MFASGKVCPETLIQIGFQRQYAKGAHRAREFEIDDAQVKFGARAPEVSTNLTNACAICIVPI